MQLIVVFLLREGENKLCPHLKPDKITPERLYISRRKFLAGMGAVAATAFIAACTRRTAGTPPGTSGFCDGAQSIGTADELGANLTTCTDITTYNNFYEFSYNKDDVASLSRDFKTSPWTGNCRRAGGVTGSLHRR